MKIIITGTVQGVGFRPTVYRVANSLGLRGYVLNKGSYVEICIDRPQAVAKFLHTLKEELPPIASMNEIIVEEYEEEAGAWEDFKIIKSEEEEEELRSNLIPIPVDTSLCDACLKELFDKNNRRYLYPFTNCTVCGARFSVISDVPYDRERTSMREFKMCDACYEEYTNPKSRRFHAQTISCPNCGPSFKLYGKNRGLLEEKEPIKVFANILDEGYIGVAKGWGGMHILCRLEEETVKKFRSSYKRPEKPFAIMLRDLEAVKKYAEVNEFEEKLLLSAQKPIVLLDKKNNLLECISPGLPNLGIYLPYSAFHHVLFRYLKGDGVLMTSANIPGEPMIIDNEEAYSLDADYFLLHNRKIANRIDDSVVRCYGGKKFFTRRSRGFIPVSLKLPYKGKVASVGAERDISFALSINGNLFLSQYMGNARYYKTMEFLRKSSSYLLNALSVREIEAVGIDLHPGYATRAFGSELAEMFNAPVEEIQHHWAHAASLMLDNGLEEIVALTLDGTGYGTDAKVWGGEILASSYANFCRIGHLEEIPLIGGEEAIRDPRRVVFAISEQIEQNSPLSASYFEGKKAEVLRKMMKKPQTQLTSSFGRVLDALSCCLGICCERTYDGEPAMKFERYLSLSELKPKYEFKTEKRGAKILTLPLFKQLFDILSRFERKGISIEAKEREKANLAYSFVFSLLQEMTNLAIDHAEKEGISVGITGGVSYNVPIVRIVEKLVKDAGIDFVTHREIPNGDGGISAGQNAIVGHKFC